MVKTFLESKSGSVGIFEAVHAETEGRISAENFVEELSALFDLEVVSSVERSFVNVGSEFGLFGFSFSTADVNFQSENVIDLEFLIVDFLIEGFSVDDDLISVDEMLLEIVRKNSFQWIDFVTVTNFLDGVSDLVVEVSWL